MAIRNAFSNQNEGAFITINVITEKEGKTDEKSGAKQEYIFSRKQLF